MCVLILGGCGFVRLYEKIMMVDRIKVADQLTKQEIFLIIWMDVSASHQGL